MIMIKFKIKGNFIDNKVNYKILFTIYFAEKNIQSKHSLQLLSIKKKHLISIEKIHYIKNMYTWFFENRALALIGNLMALVT